MSRKPEQRTGQQSREPRLIELKAAGNGLVKFEIESDHTGADVKATLDFIEPDEGRRQIMVNEILRHAIAEGKLDHREMEFGTPTSEHASVTHMVRFGYEPTMEEVTTIYQKLFGDEAPEQLSSLLWELVDEGRFVGVPITGDQHTEIEGVSDERIEVEMGILTDYFENGEI